MAEFFRGWKRKVGVVTLILACLFMGGWLRSRSKSEWMGIAVPGSHLNFISGCNRFRIVVGYMTMILHQRTHNGIVETAMIVEKTTDVIGSPIYWHIELRTLEWSIYGRVGIERCEMMMFSYWSVVIPLILISAWLLLSRQHKSKPSGGT